MTPEQEMELQVLRIENELLKKSYEQLSIQNANMSDRMQASAFAQARMDRLDRNLATLIDAISRVMCQMNSLPNSVVAAVKKATRKKPKAKKSSPSSRKKK